MIVDDTLFFSNKKKRKKEPKKEKKKVNKSFRKITIKKISNKYIIINIILFLFIFFIFLFFLCFSFLFLLVLFFFFSFYKKRGYHDCVVSPFLYFPIEERIETMLRNSSIHSVVASSVRPLSHAFKQNGLSSTRIESSMA